MNFFLYLNSFDFFVLIIFFSSLLIGLSRGLYIEIISNAIWISAILLAWFFRYYPMEIFDNFTNDKEIKSIFSFVSIFIVLLIVFRITGKAIMKGMNSMQKGLLDRIHSLHNCLASNSKNYNNDVFSRGDIYNHPNMVER